MPRNKSTNLDLVTATKLIKDDAYSIWCVIGHDVLTCSGEDELSKDSVTEIVIDRFESNATVDAVRAIHYLNEREPTPETQAAPYYTHRRSIYPLGELARQAISSAFTCDGYSF